MKNQTHGCTPKYRDDIQKKLFGRPQLCDSPRSRFSPSLSAIFLSLSVCMCHILTPVCRCGPGHRCRCNLSGPILVLGQIFFACVCMQQPCVCVGACEAMACLIKPCRVVCGWASQLFSSTRLYFCMPLCFVKCAREDELVLKSSSFPRFGMRMA